MRPPLPPRPYQQTDLDLHADFDLRPLCEGLVAGGMYVLHCTEVRHGRWQAILERDSEDEGTPGEPETSLRLLLDAIEALPEDLRANWDRCDLRAFDIGFNARWRPFCWQTPLSAETLRRVAAVGASLGITIYAPDRETRARVHAAGPPRRKIGRRPTFAHGKVRHTPTPPIS